MIDTLYTLRTIPIAATINDSIVGSTTIGGCLEIGVKDSLNFVLSGSPSVRVVMPEETDWAMVIGIVTICINILVLLVTCWHNRILQKSETEEIRTRAIQDVAIQKQAKLYEMLVNLSYIIQDPNNDSNSIDMMAFKDKLEQTKLFISTNHLYIRDNLEEVTYDLLNIFSSLTEMPDAKTMNNIDKNLAEYCKVYNTPNEIRKTRKNRILNSFKNIFCPTHK